MRALWDTWQNGTKLNFRGEYYKLTLMSPFFTPPPLSSSISPISRGSRGDERGLIPIYIAGVNTGLAKLAGELCEGFHVHPFNSPRYLHQVILPAIAEGADKAKRKGENVVISVTAFAATSAEEENFARTQISFYASTPSYRSVMDFYGWGGVAEKLSAHAAKGEWPEMPTLIADEMLNEFCLVTSPEKLAGELKVRYKGIADRLALYTPFVPGERDEFWKKIASEINPE
jgi:probable F420-dependent oxidoreductase